MGRVWIAVFLAGAMLAAPRAAAAAREEGEARRPAAVAQSAPQPLLGSAEECLAILTRAEWARVPTANSNYARAQDCIRKIDAALAPGARTQPTPTITPAPTLPPENTQPRTEPQTIPSVTLPERAASPVVGPATTPAGAVTVPSPPAGKQEQRDARPQSGGAPDVERGSREPSAAVLSEGSGRIRRAGAASDTPLTEGGVIRAGDEIRTGPNERAVLAFSDGSKIVIGPNGSFVLEDPQARTWLQQAGRVLYDIKTGNLFRVRVKVRNPATVSIRGTQFNIDVAPDEGSFRVEVSEGVVEVTSAERSVEVQAGQAVTVQSGEPPPAPAAMPAAAGQTAGGTEASRGGVMAGAAAGTAVVAAAGGALWLLRVRGRGRVE